MDITVSVSLLITLGGMLVSIASAFAIVKTKVTALEREFEEAKKMIDSQKEEIAEYRENEKVRLALIEKNQESHNKEMSEIKEDVKTTMLIVQKIERVLIKKGEM